MLLSDRSNHPIGPTFPLPLPLPSPTPLRSPPPHPNTLYYSLLTSPHTSSHHHISFYLPPYPPYLFPHLPHIPIHFPTLTPYTLPHIYHTSSHPPLLSLSFSTPPCLYDFFPHLPPQPAPSILLPSILPTRSILLPTPPPHFFKSPHLPLP